MEMHSFFSSDFFSLVCIPLAIFLVRIVDVSMGTLRIISVSQGARSRAAILGFFEVLIWLVALSQLIREGSSLIHYFAYAAGFGTGTFVGVSIEKRVGYGKLLIRVIVSSDAARLMETLRERGYGVTTIRAQGTKGPVTIIFTVAKRNCVTDILKIITRCNPKAFYTIENINFASARSFLVPASRPSVPGYFFQKRK
ncbi:MAG: DUF2179 domain-containing protein [Candidatus Omnitrophica bacterium]|nr:DUF2179 domain-containing protein [Candidatus Omnitrophota bacterium]